MDIRHLVDGIVRQTTVLIAQLSTAAGVRAPLAKVADQVFLDLTREIESQGIRRKVIADMFGMALRTYQKKVNRLTESVDTRNRTLWESVLEYLRNREKVARKQIFERFKSDDPPDVAAVLKDLVSTGLVQRTGRGDEALYSPTRDSDFMATQEQEELETITNLVWLAIYDNRSISRAELNEKLSYPQETTEQAIETLIGDGRITTNDESGTDILSCTKLTIPVGAKQGWEVAVYDHFTAVTTAIATKLRGKTKRSLPDDIVGGSTLAFRVCSGHPYEKEVYGLLRRVRQDVNQLWDKVSNYNKAHPLDPAETIDVSFYFGQSVVEHENNSVSEDSIDKKADKR